MRDPTSTCCLEMLIAHFAADHDAHLINAWALCLGLQTTASRSGVVKSAVTGNGGVKSWMLDTFHEICVGQLC